jgi:hypothetical protein
MKTVFLTAMTGWVLAGGTAFAGERLSAAIDVNIRSGPGAKYPIVTVLHAGDAILSRQCGEQSGWCSVAMPGGGEGWIASKFLSPAAQGTADASLRNDAASAKAATPAGIDTTTTTASIPEVGSPASLVLPDAVSKFVATHRPLSIDLGAEPTVGSILPADVRLRDIPGSRYQYVYVQGHPVFVDGQSRRVMKVEP